MRSLDVPAGADDSPPGDSVESISKQVRAILASQRDGQRILRFDQRDALVQASRSLATMRRSVGVGRPRVDALAQQVDHLLRTSEAASGAAQQAMQDFIEPFRAGTEEPPPRPARPAAWDHPEPAADDSGADEWDPDDEAASPTFEGERWDTFDPGVEPRGTWVDPPEPDDPPAAAAPASVEPQAPPRPDRRVRRLAGACLALTVLVAALAWLSVNNYSSSSSWRRLAHAQAFAAAQAEKQVVAANSHISQLNAEVKSLDGQITGMQSQLSSVANQKEKAIDQQAVLQQLVGAEAQVADALTQCIGDSNTLQTDMATAVGSGDVARVAGLEPEAAHVTAICRQAESANQVLQAAIPSGA